MTNPQPGLRYTPDIKQRVAIPQEERSLQTVVAEPWFKVSDKNLGIEGPAFDRENNLYFVHPLAGMIHKLSPDMRLEVILPENKLLPGGIAIHKDGRLFVGGVGNVFADVAGSLFVIGPDGQGMATIIPEAAGYRIDDLVFDAQGGFYFSDFSGTSTDPSGGVYYVTPDLKTIVPVLPRLSAANGVGLSPDGKTLWVTEYCKGLLHRLKLSGPGTVALYGTAVVYQFSGTPDSVRVDADGNVYVAMLYQGRILVFSPDGIAIGQILIPGRETGRFLASSSLAIKPGTDELYIVASDHVEAGCAIFRSHGFAHALRLFSHF